MNRLLRSVVLATFLSGWAGGMGNTVWALGFRNPDQGARATGQGEAFVAQADDATAIHYNPAGLTQLAGTHIASGGYLVFRDIEFSGALGADKLNDPAFTPNLFVATDLGQERWRYGLGVNIPFGNSMDWGDGPFSLILREASLIVYNFAPTVACRINDHLSLGVGLNLYYGDTELQFDFSPLLPGSRARFEGDGSAVGATIGLLWKLNEQHAFGFVYRSPFEIAFDGDARVSNAGPFTTRASAEADIEFPQQVVVGYAFRPTPKLKLEVNVDWTNWDTLNTVRLATTDPVIAGDPRTTIPFNWLDSFYYEFGAQYDLTDRWVVRAGYIFSENSVPTDTFSPNLPDADRHVFSVGVGYDSREPVLGNVLVHVDLAYQYALSEDRRIPSFASSASPFVDGTWESQSHAVMLTTSLKF